MEWHCIRFSLSFIPIASWIYATLQQNCVGHPDNRLPKPFGVIFYHISSFISATLMFFPQRIYLHGPTWLTVIKVHWEICISQIPFLIRHIGRYFIIQHMFPNVMLTKYTSIKYSYSLKIEAIPIAASISIIYYLWHRGIFNVFRLMPGST